MLLFHNILNFAHTEKQEVFRLFLNFGFRGVVKLTSFFRISCVLYVSFKIESRVENTCYVPYIQPYFRKRVSMCTGTIFTKFFLNIFRQLFIYQNH